MVKKQYLCSGFKNRHNLFCTLKINRLIPWKNSRRETAFFMVLRSVSEAIPNRSRQKDGFFLYMVLRNEVKQYHMRGVKITAFFLVLRSASEAITFSYLLFFISSERRR